MKTIKLVDGFITEDESYTYDLIADFEDKEVITNCGDFYYDYSINFDDFIKFAHFIEQEEKRLEKSQEEESDGGEE